LQILSTGQLNIYFDENKTGNHYYIEKEGLGLNDRRKATFVSEKVSSRTTTVGVGHCLKLE